jgi:hypothetical protein
MSQVKRKQNGCLLFNPADGAVISSKTSVNSYQTTGLHVRRLLHGINLEN